MEFTPRAEFSAPAPAPAPASPMKLQIPAERLPAPQPPPLQIPAERLPAPQLPPLAHSKTVPSQLAHSKAEPSHLAHSKAEPSHLPHSKTVPSQLALPKAAPPPQKERQTGAQPGRPNSTSPSVPTADIDVKANPACIFDAICEANNDDTSKLLPLLNQEPDSRTLNHHGPSIVLGFADEKHCTAAFKAAYYGFDACLHLLIDARADLSIGCRVDSKTEVEMTPLHGAAQAGNKACVEMLIEAPADAGVDVNARDWYGRTATLYTAIHNHTPCLQLLLKGNVSSRSRHERAHRPPPLARRRALLTPPPALATTNRPIPTLSTTTKCRRPSVPPRKAAPSASRYARPPALRCAQRPLNSSQRTLSACARARAHAGAHCGQGRHRAGR